MKTIVSKFLPLVVTVVLSAGLAAAGSDQGKPNPLDVMKPLIGTWQGEMKLQDGSQFNVEVEFRWGVAHRVIHYQVISVGAEGRTLWAEATCFWNPVALRIEFNEYTIMGSVSKGEISWKDDQAEMMWKELTPNGETAYKDTLRLPTSDTWTSFPLQKTAGGWEPVMEQITYHRVK